MYCYKCGAKNHNQVNFCRRCGTNLSHLKNVKISNANFFKLLAYNKLIKSKNKYRNAYLLICASVLSIFFVTTLIVNFQHTLDYAINAISPNNTNMAIAFAKTQAELAFRDVWCYIFLSLCFILVIVCNTIIFAYTLSIKIKQK